MSYHTGEVVRRVISILTIVVVLTLLVVGVWQQSVVDVLAAAVLLYFGRLAI